MFGMRNQLERILQEYPWMWAVNPHWTRDQDRIIFCTMQPTDPYVNCDPEFEWWIKFSETKGGVRQGVMKVSCHPDLVLGEAISPFNFTGTMNFEYLVCHKICHTAPREYHIYRAPNGLSLFEMCLAAKNETAIARKAQANGQAVML